MRTKIISALAVAAALLLCYPANGRRADAKAVQEKQYSVYAIGFYNLENLFDTVHDKGKNDYQYTPNGSLRWNGLKYRNKLKNLARALADMGTEQLKNVGCAAIGVAEVENRQVLVDLINQEPLKARGYKFIHYEGPDRRGIDCALLYNPKLFHVTKSVLLPYRPELQKDSDFKTRGYLLVEGQMAGEHVAIIVNHWPSRTSTSFYRETAGRQNKAIKDSLVKADPKVKVLIMGDMNDDPRNKSMVQALQCKAEQSEVTEDDMYNPWFNIHKKGIGTLTYQGSWNLFDQIVMSPSLVNTGKIKDFSTLKYWKCAIQRRNYLLQTDGKYKGSPKRTHAGGSWLNGYSDHLPVVVFLSKEKK